MRKRGRRARPQPPADRWFVYLLRCADGSLYTGAAKDVGRRLRQHNAGTASRYTRCRRPVEVVYREAHPGRGLALRREAAIKALTRRQKEALIRQAPGHPSAPEVRLRDEEHDAVNPPVSSPGRAGRLLRRLQAR